MITPSGGSTSASPQRVDESHAETAESVWKSLYRVGGAAALITAVLIPAQMIVFVASPPPLGGTAIDWFAVLRANRLLGLLDLDLLLIVDNVLLIPILLALYVALRRTSESLTAIGTALGFVGIAAYFASNTAFNMLSLSDQYAAATTDAQRSTLLAAGQAMLAIYQGTAFDVYYILGSVSALMISVVMLRSNIFSRVAAYAGILANVIALGLFVPTIGIYLSLGSVVLLEVWYILIARRLFQLGQGVPK